MTEIMEQTKQLHEADMYLPVKVGYEWKFKTLHGVETYRTKRRATEMADKWKRVDTREWDK